MTQHEALVSELRGMVESNSDLYPDEREILTLAADALEARSQDEPCGVCVGKGEALSGPCICDGKGTRTAELQGLRVALYNATHLRPLPADMHPDDERDLREALTRLYVRYVDIGGNPAWVNATIHSLLDPEARQQDSDDLDWLEATGATVEAWPPDVRAEVMPAWRRDVHWSVTRASVEYGGGTLREAIRAAREATKGDSNVL